MIFLSVYMLIVPFLYGNWLGVAVGISMILVILLGLFLKSIMTNELYEKVLTVICVLSLISTSWAISERFVNIILNHGHSTHRISAMFSHPNYFGTVAGTVIIICAYKVFSQGHKWFCYIAIMNVISIYLSKSMFAWVEVFIGITVLLLLLKKPLLLAVWLFGAALCGYLIFVLDINVIPRLSDIAETTKLHQGIWELAVEQIKRSPFIGHGFMSYLYVFKNYYHYHPMVHAHSLYLDMMLNFGLMGILPAMWYLIKFYRTVFRACFKAKNYLIATLVLSVTAAALVHGITDLTLFWIQTLPLFLIILAGMGVYDKHKGKASSAEIHLRIDNNSFHRVGPLKKVS